MAYEFSDRELEPEPRTAAGRSGGPPRKFTTIAVLDAPIPPKKPVGPIPRNPASLRVSLFGGIVLVALVAAILLMLFPHR
jgi:hypothetical protein